MNKPCGLSSKLFSWLNDDFLLHDEEQEGTTRNKHLASHYKLQNPVSNDNNPLDVNTLIANISPSKAFPTELITSNSSASFGWIDETPPNLLDSTLPIAPLKSDFTQQSTFIESSDIPQEATLSRSGDSRIDPLISGYKWGITTIRFSFFTSGSKYFGTEANVAPISEAAKSNVRYILSNLIEPLINVNFVEVADSNASYGQIRYLNSTTPSYAYAYYPSSTDTNQGNGNDIAGDVFFNSRYDNAIDTNGIQGGAGTHGYQTIIHETLHALGLKHPGNYNGSGTGDPPYIAYGEDNWDNTLMTYNSKSGAEPSTPMAYDILALQYLYGAKTSTNSSNTTYTFTKADSYNDGSQTVGSSSLSDKLTIWDGGGIDTLNFDKVASSSSGFRFDMNAGGWLSTQAAYNSSKYDVTVGPPVSYTTGTTYSATKFGTRIAYGTTIENLINSSYNDEIIANAAANIFSGYSPSKFTGNDRIVGANNLDTLDLSAFSSSAVNSSKSGNDLVLGLGTGTSNSSITLKDYYANSNQIKIKYFASSNWQVSGVKDFGTDGKSDILWRNPTTDQNAIWQMSSNNLIGGDYLPSLAASWNVGGLGDFGGDGKNDIFWRNSDGTNAIWQLDGKNPISLIGGDYLPSLATTWKVGGVADFGGDGKSDIFWRNSDGTNAIWQLNGANLIGGDYLPTLSTDWTVGGLADFGGDGKADIFWRNSVTGQNAIWQLDGKIPINLIGGDYLPTLSTDWIVGGVGDFGGDGKADIFWRNSVTGQNAIWQLDGKIPINLIGGDYLPTLSTDWTVGGVGDFGGDGKSDIFWRNASTGQNAIWELNGSTLIASNFTPSLF